MREEHHLSAASCTLPLLAIEPRNLGMCFDPESSSNLLVPGWTLKLLSHTGWAGVNLLHEDRTWVTCLDRCVKLKAQVEGAVDSAVGMYGHLFLVSDVPCTFHSEVALRRRDVSLRGLVSPVERRHCAEVWNMEKIFLRLYSIRLSMCRNEEMAPLRSAKILKQGSLQSDATGV